MMAILLGLVFGLLFSSLRSALAAAFSVVFGLWFLSIVAIDAVHGYSVGPVLVTMLGLKHLSVVYLVSSLLPALMAVLAGWVGFSFKKLF